MQTGTETSEQLSGDSSTDLGELDLDSIIAEGGDLNDQAAVPGAQGEHCNLDTLQFAHIIFLRCTVHACMQTSTNNWIEKVSLRKQRLRYARSCSPWLAKHNMTSIDGTGITASHGSTSL